jgi:hypothetical protein
MIFSTQLGSKSVVQLTGVSPLRLEQPGGSPLLLTKIFPNLISPIQNTAFSDAKGIHSEKTPQQILILPTIGLHAHHEPQNSFLFLVFILLCWLLANRYNRVPKCEEGHLTIPFKSIPSVYFKTAHTQTANNRNRNKYKHKKYNINRTRTKQTLRKKRKLIIQVTIIILFVIFAQGFTIIYLKQTMSVGYILLQLFCTCNLWYL